MERKYQVFVSSTYEDLKTERQAVTSCLLDINCIPVGMEQFPASSLSQWEYIKKMIDMSDYYLLIVAGKYGTIDLDENISYTEKEYRYAVNKEMPVLSFLHENIDLLPAGKVGKTEEERVRIVKFRNEVKNAGRLIDFYNSAEDLKYKIATAMSKIINDAPRPGWVRADQAERAIEIAGDMSGFKNIQKWLELTQNSILEKVEQTRIQWEPISADEIKEMFKTESKNSSEGLKMPTLSSEAKMLLLEAAKDSAGQILLINSFEGTYVQTNNIVMNSAKIGKDVAVWKAAIEELQSNKLAISVSNKNEIFQLTKLGYDVSEGL